MPGKTARPQSNTRLPLYGLVLTLVGLFALLAIPILRRIQSTDFSARISQMEKARLQIDEALEKAHEARGYILYFYYMHEPPHNNVSFERILTDWKEVTRDPENMAECDQTTQKQWQAGHKALTEWFTKYGRRNAADGVLGEGQDEFEKSSRLFDQGIMNLQSARKGAEQQEKQIRILARSSDSKQNAVTIALAAISFVLALLAWLNLRGMRRAWAREQEISAQLEVAVKESNHRIKNNLQVIGALLDMQMQEPGDTIPKSVLDGVVHQVRAVAAVHDFLSHEMRSDRVQGDLMLQQLVTLTASPIGLSVNLEAEAVTLAVKQATAVALITNELLLNSGKHGATQAHICMTAEGDRASLRVADNGPGFPDDFELVQNANLGLTLVETLTRHDLKGEIAFRNRDGAEGAEVVITFPLTEYAPTS